MAKMTSWQAPTVVRRYKTPTGPLAAVDQGMAQDYSKQRAEVPHPIGARNHEFHTMNDGGTAAHAILTSLDSVPLDQFPFPK